MKTLSLLLVGCLTALSVFAQDLSTVSITVKGTRNQQVLVDGQAYTVNNDINSVNNNSKTPITITGLTPGQHNLQVIRSSQYSGTNTNNTTVFNLRSGYDMNIIINSNGSVQLNEVRRKRNWGNNQNNAPMSTTEFNQLYNDILDIRSSSGKTTAVTNAFANVENNFTTAQARQLIQLVTSQTSRLKIAKASYRSITDRANFSNLYDLLNSKAHRNELAAYVTAYNAKNPVGNPGNTGNATTPMSDASFKLIYQEGQQAWPATSKLSYLNSTFNNTNHFFSTSQAKQLLQLLNAETDRLQIAKVAYRSITDKVNFSQVYDLLSSQSARNELASYVSVYNNNNPEVQTAMSSARFSTIYSEVQQQYASSRVTYLTNLFQNTGNYYTSSQARQLIQLVSDDPSRLYLSKLSYRGITDRTNFTTLYDLLNSQASRNELAAYVSTYGSGGIPVIPTMAMSDTEFNNLYRDVSNKFGLGIKMASLTEIFNNTAYFFTTSQARQLIQLVSTESNRFDLAKLSYNNIVDPANFSMIYDVLASQSSRDELANWVRNNGGVGTGGGYGTVKTPMSDASYNALYNDISNQFGLFVKYSSLTDVFNNASYYFTTAQAKKLIQLVSSESNRLQLAKLSYGNITDPENFSLLYDVLASQSSRNELIAYVNSYSYN